ncbi:hypothetical protein BDR07DRAFT_1608491 [Suillus spraguei]|nr:hypothetical protein BDR07DRAFT_1608491 [Suillus spraguei]
MVGLDERRKLAFQAVQDVKTFDVGGWDWERQRRMVLCSATIREGVQKLASTALIRLLVIKSLDKERAEDSPAPKHDNEPATTSAEKFTLPSQLSQKYDIVPLKMRLIALLHSLLAQTHGQKGSKIIVFLSCTDSAESNEVKRDNDGDKTDGFAEEEKAPQSSVFMVPFPLQSVLPLYAVSLLFLRQNLRNVLLHPPFSFARPWHPRGLDLPLVRAVIQHDLPTEGGATDYVHKRISMGEMGRGEDMAEEKSDGDTVNITLEGTSIEGVLAKGFGGKGSEYEARATEVQLSFERWVLRRKENAELARRAFTSHTRAYATHPSNEKHIFHVRHLHIGHLAKAFALREAPKTITDGKNKTASVSKSRGSRPAKNTKQHDVGDVKQRMQNIVHAQGRLSKKGGKMISSGTDEFQIA